ncbi:MAG: hypothetical protein ACE5FU_09425 [Nitrospinota bacterium]
MNITFRSHTIFNNIEKSWLLDIQGIGLPKSVLTVLFANRLKALNKEREA